MSKTIKYLAHKFIPKKRVADSSMIWMFEQRWAPFISSAAHNNPVYGNFTYGGVHSPNYHIGQLDFDGHLRQTLVLKNVAPGKFATFNASMLVEDGDKEREFSQQFHIEVANAEGMGVISDIDDTIKHSKVLSYRAMIEHGFYKYYEPESGMINLYYHMRRSLQTMLTAPSGDITWSKPVFFYLSASPWQLVEPVSEFIKRFFPSGELLLNHIKLNSFSGLRALASVANYKRDNVARILSKFPKRRFILIGDSGQKDPEAYAQVYRDHPDQVACIMIRKVEGTNARVERSKNDAARFEKTFKGIPKEKWVTFSDTAQLFDEVDFKTTCRPKRWQD